MIQEHLDIHLVQVELNLAAERKRALKWIIFSTFYNPDLKSFDQKFRQQTKNLILFLMKVGKEEVIHGIA